MTPIEATENSRLMEALKTAEDSLSSCESLLAAIRVASGTEVRVLVDSALVSIRAGLEAIWRVR